MEASYPLSPLQHGMLYHHLKRGPHTGVDVVQLVASLHERVDEGALLQAWEQVAQRHPVLRTRFRWEGRPEPVQEVLARVDLRIDKHSLLALPAAERAARLEELILVDRLRGFAFDDAPLWRLSLVDIEPAEHHMVWTFSHALLDGASLLRVVKEVFTLYEALRGGRTVSLDAPRPYRDHIAWLAGEISQKREIAAARFGAMLAGLTAPTPLPWSAAEQRAPRGAHVLGEQEMRLSRQVTDALRALGERRRISLRTCVQGAWAIVLGAHAGEDDVVFGAARECRDWGLPRAWETVGMFLNTLPVRVRIEDDAKVLPWLENIGAAQAALREIEHTPLVEVQATSALARGAGLFESLVVYREALEDTILRAEGGPWARRRFRVLEQTIFPLALFAYGEPELLLKLSYDPARFDEATISRLLAQLGAVLAAMAGDPGQAVGALPRLPEEERRTVLDTWNRTAVPYERERCVHELIEEQAERSPDRVALAFRDASLTYRELDARADALAYALRAEGVGPDVRVGICVERSIEMVVGLLGILKAGGAYVPLDPSYPRARLAVMLEDAEISIIVTRSQLVPSLPPHGARLVLVDTLPAEPPDGLPRSLVGPDDLAYVIFTSGSTGRPKGVMVRHRNVVNLFAGMDALLGGEGPGVWLALTSIAFDISVLELLWTLARGFKVVVEEEGPLAALPAGGARAVRGSGMAFSLFYFAADAGERGGDKYRLLLEGAKFADEHGFSAVWTPERHFHAFGGLYPNPAVTSAAVAAVTKHVQIRGGSIVLPLHNPIRVAEEWSVVDNLSGGRVGLSFASGWHARDFALLPENYEDRREVMARGIEAVRKLWRGEAIQAKSGDGSEIDVRIFPAPIQKDPPIWVTTSGSPETFELAGRTGANVLTNMLGQSVSDLRSKIARYRAARREAGHAGEGHVTLMLHTFLGSDVDVVREKVRGPLIDYLRTSTELVKQGHWEFPSFAQPGKERAGDAARAADGSDLRPEEVDAMLDHAFERYFQTSGLFGTPESCLAMVRTLEDAGVDEIACLIDFGAPADDVLSGLAHLDRLRALSAPQAAPERAEWDIPAQIRRRGVTHMQCTPTLARMLASSDDTLAALAPLQKLLLGGEALPPALAARLGEVVSGDILNMYGPTETTVWSTAKVVGKAHRSITIGRPLANTEVYILDSRMAPVPIGAVGEIFIGGAGVASGYLGRPDLTRARFVPSPFSSDPGARLYRTGDLARYLPDGDIEILGRADQQVKIRGHRIELGEIEAALTEHPEVRAAAAAAREDAAGDKRIVAYVVAAAPDDEAGALVGELRTHLRARLPEAMAPSAIVILDALPLTPNGKIDRKALPAPDREQRASASYVAPANEVEQKIVEVWQAILNVERIGVRDDVFTLGANSLLVIQANGKLRAALGRDLSLVEMFRFPSASELAAHVDEMGGLPPSLQESRDRARTRGEAMRRLRRLRGEAR